MTQLSERLDRAAGILNDVYEGEYAGEIYDLLHEAAKALTESDLLLRSWIAVDAGAWHVERHAREKAELLAETREFVAKLAGEE